MSEDVKPAIKAEGFEHPDTHAAEPEELEVSSHMNQSKVWAIKVPRFLLERWERVDKGGVHLGTLLVDNSSITLKLPDTPDDKEDVKGKDKGERPAKRSRTELDTRGIPDEYDVLMPSEHPRNSFIFTERQRTWVAKPGASEGSVAKRKREKAEPRLLARLDHEANVRPIHNAKYLEVLRKRRLDSESSKRPLVRLDESQMSRAKLNQLASGFSNAASQLGKGMIVRLQVTPGERNARMERHELTDRLFDLFSEKPYWTITGLRQTLKQPDAWLREVLKDVAVLIREGPYANMWELLDNWKGGAGGGGGGGGGEAKPEQDDSSDEEEDEDDELELVEV